MNDELEPQIVYSNQEVPVLLDGDDPFAWDVVAAIAQYCRKACGIEIDCESITIVLVEQRPVWRVTKSPSQDGHH